MRSASKQIMQLWSPSPSEGVANARRGVVVAADASRTAVSARESAGLAISAGILSAAGSGACASTFSAAGTSTAFVTSQGVSAGFVAIKAAVFAVAVLDTAVFAAAVFDTAVFVRAAADATPTAATADATAAGVAVAVLAADVTAAGVTGAAVVNESAVPADCLCFALVPWPGGKGCDPTVCAALARLRACRPRLPTARSSSTPSCEGTSRPERRTIFGIAMSIVAIKVAIVNRTIMDKGHWWASGRCFGL